MLICFSWREFPMLKTVMAISKYSICYPDPLMLNTGDSVEVLKSESKSGPWFGWHFCKASDGKEGWISMDYMSLEGRKGVIQKKYTAKELNAKEKEKFERLYSSCGWSWCRNEKGEEGWLPSNILESTINLQFVRPSFAMYEDFYQWRSDPYAVKFNPLAECSFETFSQKMEQTL